MGERGAVMWRPIEEYTPFRCDRCNSSHFGSILENRPDGSVWKIAERCHDEFDVGCYAKHMVEPVCLIPAKERLLMRGKNDVERSI